MITYVDTSTLMKLLMEEAGSAEAETIWRRAEVLSSAKIGYVEACAALAAARRARRLTAAQHRRAVDDLGLLWNQLSIMEITDEVVERAANLTDECALRGYDAVHLAAAIEVGATVFTSADRQLCDAARSVGLFVANPIEPPPPR